MIQFNGWFEAVATDNNFYCQCGSWVKSGDKVYLKIKFTDICVCIEEVICQTCMMKKYPMLFVIEKLPF